MDDAVTHPQPRRTADIERLDQMACHGV